MKLLRTLAVLTLVLALAGNTSAQVTSDAPALGKAQAIVDLTTEEGVRLVRGEWRYSDAAIVAVDHRSPGPDLKPSGAPNRTHDVVPHAGEAGFDDSKWPVLAPPELRSRRSTGRLCFNWYRIAITIPEKVGRFATAGSTVVFEVVVDDYAEIWVDGTLPVVIGQTGGPLARGFNAPNRVVVARDARPGQKIQLAVFGANAPLSSPPGNFIWVRSATLDFYRAGDAGTAQRVESEVEKLDPTLDAIVPRPLVTEKLAGGFEFIEGPVWVREGGYLLFSDPNRNVIYRWTRDGEVSIFRTKSGYAGFDVGEYGQPGSNGLTLDREGRLVIDEHGNRRVTRLERNGVVTVLADRYEGKRLNSPNDLVYRSDGTLYFTDPPFGLPKFHDDSRRELPFTGVFRLTPDGKLHLERRELTGPNGLAFSPDEKFLYVDDWDEKRKVVMRYDVRPDGGLAGGEVLFDITRSVPGELAWDGLKVDEHGNLYVAGPGGIWILSAGGKHLGTIGLPEQPANFAWGDDDGRALYVTARTGLYRVRLGVAGIRP